MYFITNQNGNVVAANKEFLEQIGSRDICSISTSLKSKQIILDENEYNLSFINSENQFKYSKTTIFSAFGDLNLYQVFEVSKAETEIDDSDIAYLKKLKNGSINNEDNNFNIPEISNKDIQENSKEDTLLTTPKEEPTENIQIYKTLSTKDLTPKKENIENELNDKIEIAKTDNKVEELIKDIELVDTKPIEEIKEKEEVINIEEVVEPTKILDLNEKTIDTDNKETNKDINKQKGGLDFLKSKLFPWGSSKEKSSDDIEIEEENVISTAKDLANKEIDKSKEDSYSKIDEIVIEDINNTKESIDTPIINIEEDSYKKEKNEDEALSLINIDNNIKEVQEEQTNEKREDKSSLTLEEEELLILKETTLNSEIKDAKPEEVTIKEKLEKKEVVEDRTIQENKTVKKDKLLLQKLVELQAKKIDFKENAQNISINLDDYKLLLGNFFEELDNYKSNLEQGDRATIDMLIDASSLLSLESITKKLTAISSNYNKDLSIKELYLLKDILQNRLNDKVKIDDTLESIEPKHIEEPSINIEEDKTKEILNSEEDNIVVDEIVTKTPPKIPNEAIEITDADKLYKVIEKIDTNFDADRPSNELNLPRTLILEFISDFITQAKDHIPKMVNSYTKRDIKTMQTTAHMLKGAASNLRLDEIAKILLSIQKENNLERSGELLKEFIGNLKGLENQLNANESENNAD